MVSINQEQSNYLTYGQMNVINDIRLLWLQLAQWTRLFFISTITDLGNLEAVSDRLYRLPREFYNKLRLFFYPTTSERFLNLLSLHIIIAERLAIAMKNGDTESIERRTAQWYQNADEIAEFLAEINPYWDKEQWKNLLYQYLDMQIESLASILAGNYEQDIEIYDRIEAQALLIADYMAKGIIQYFLSA